MTEAAYNKAPLTQDEAVLKVYNELSKEDQQTIDSIAIAKKYDIDSAANRRSDEDPDASLESLATDAARGAVDAFNSNPSRDRVDAILELVWDDSALVKNQFPTSQQVHNSLVKNHKDIVEWLQDELGDVLPPSDIPLKLPTKNPSSRGQGQ